MSKSAPSPIGGGKEGPDPVPPEETEEPAWVVVAVPPATGVAEPFPERATAATPAATAATGHRRQERRHPWQAGTRHAQPAARRGRGGRGVGRGGLPKKSARRLVKERERARAHQARHAD